MYFCFQITLLLEMKTSVPVSRSRNLFFLLTNFFLKPQKLQNSVIFAVANSAFVDRMKSCFL